MIVLPGNRFAPELNIYLGGVIFYPERVNVYPGGVKINSLEVKNHSTREGGKKRLFVPSRKVVRRIFPIPIYPSGGRSLRGGPPPAATGEGAGIGYPSPGLQRVVTDLALPHLG